MPRYIDAHRAETLLRMCGTYHGVISFDTVIDVLHDTQTADVVERKKGRWIKHEDRTCWYCSECNEDNYYAYVWNGDTGEYVLQDHYCPNCGAEMVKGEEDGHN